MSATVQRMLRHGQHRDFVCIAVLLAANLLAHPNRITVIGCTIFGIGFLLNRLVCVLNEGFMLIAANEEALPESIRDRYKPIDGESRVVFLSDWIRLGPWLISPGDILVAIGVIGIILGFLIHGH